jgi:hypothetical protein
LVPGNTGGAQNTPNGLAFDEDNGLLYFSVNPGGEGQPSQLWYCTPNPTAPDQTPVRVGGAANFTLQGQAAGAAFYEGEYYYFVNEATPEQLNAVDPSVPSERIVASDFATEAPTTLVFRGGDLAFLACDDSEILYASSLGSAGGTLSFFSLDITTTPVYDLITQASDRATGKQLAFAATGDGQPTLFAHSTGTSEFFTVDLATGEITSVFFGLSFTDITSPTSCENLFDGCTPGYWKEPHHFDSWVCNSPSDLFEDVFGVEAIELDGLTLIEVLNAKGGGENALGRHAVAALLSACSEVNYLYTEAEVIAMVQDAYDSGEFENTKDMIEAANEQGCPLD